MSQRAFGKVLGALSNCGTNVGKGVEVPDTENLARIAAKTGYSLEELMRCLESRPVAEISDLNAILRQIQHIPLSQVAKIVQAAAVETSRIQ